MAKKKYSQFESRQYMLREDFEIFYNQDQHPPVVNLHTHDYYEIYFFISGAMEYDINGKRYPLSNGNVCIIPPGIPHGTILLAPAVPYQRIVLWITESYIEKLKVLVPDIFYSFHHVKESEHYHFSLDFGSTQLIFNKLIDILEERHTILPFHDTTIDSLLCNLLCILNRIIYTLENPKSTTINSDLYINLCNYINAHLKDDLSLEALAARFYVSKYHISHAFKENMGISIHQYILKKRLHASKNGLLSGAQLQSVAEAYGFGDYTVFFRAFKKEFGVSPKEYRAGFKIEEH